MTSMRWFGPAVAASLAVMAMACGSSPTPAPGTEGAACTASSDCGTDLVCRDMRCARVSSDAGMDAAPRDADAADATTDASCASGIHCGPSLACCADGSECVLGACSASCASGVRCGDDLAECCSAGDICSGGCVTPGATCDFGFDCPVGERCEPTLGRCLPRPPTACEYHPPTGTFAPRIAWTWDVDQVVVTPVVANFTDDDGDGAIDRHDVADVVVVGFTDLEQAGRLHLLSGDDGHEIWVSATPVCAYGGIAAADIDADGSPEILAVGMVGGTCRGDADPLLAFDATGALRWTSHDASGATVGFYMGLAGAPAVTDTDGDGQAEIVAGGALVDTDGTVLWNVAPDLGMNYARGSPIPIVADVDGDSVPEVLGGNRALHSDGSTLWYDSTRADGFTAIGRFGLAPSGVELVVVSNATVLLRDAVTGAVVWGPIAHPGGNYGGPPTVADFDGDGVPEIGVAGLVNYVVYDTTETDGILWQFATVENAAAITGSSVFDFEGDGRAEVVYADQCFLRALDGRSGAVLFELSNSSGTHAENPVIADVDNDGHADIVVVANDVSSGSCTGLPGFTGFVKGVRVFSDTLGNWVATRRIWNQHAYHITNVTEDARVPASEVASWTRFNSYRQNAQDDALFAPDLVVVDAQVDESGCPVRLVLRARIANAGSAGVRAGMSVSFYRGSVASPGALLGVTTTTEPLLPGASTTVMISVDRAPTETASDFFVRVDDDGAGAGAVHECREDNNTRERPGATCTLI